MMKDAYQVVYRVGQVKVDDRLEVSEDIVWVAAIPRSEVVILIHSAIGKTEIARARVEGFGDGGDELCKLISLSMGKSVIIYLEYNFEKY